MNIHNITVYRSLHLTLRITGCARIYYVKMPELEINIILFPLCQFCFPCISCCFHQLIQKCIISQLSRCQAFLSTVHKIKNLLPCHWLNRYLPHSFPVTGRSHSIEYTTFNGYYMSCLRYVCLQCIVADRASLKYCTEYDPHFNLMNVFPRSLSFSSTISVMGDISQSMPIFLSVSYISASDISMSSNLSKCGSMSFPVRSTFDPGFFPRYPIYFVVGFLLTLCIPLQMSTHQMTQQVFTILFSKGDKTSPVQKSMYILMEP